jgi:putative nucleotidyltransferase with HDIG domain
MDSTEAVKLIRRVEDVPTLPAVISRILEVLEDERSSAGDLEKVVSRDQSIASRVLRIANSAYYGFPREITTIHRAIVILGFQTVKALALGSSVFEAFSRSGQSTCFDRTAYWLHSIACSRCAMALAEESRTLDPDVAFLAGLIHDIGMVVMDHIIHEKYSRLLKKAIKHGKSLDQLEREALGFDHGEVGALLGERWKFPPSLLDGIRFHHRISESEKPMTILLAVIHLADFCSNGAGLSVTGNVDHVNLEEEALRQANISEVNLVDLTSRVRDERDQIEEFFSAMSG